jgi:hypothetical protein
MAYHVHMAHAHATCTCHLRTADTWQHLADGTRAHTHMRTHMPHARCHRQQAHTHDTCVHDACRIRTWQQAHKHMALAHSMALPHKHLAYHVHKMAHAHATCHVPLMHRHLADDTRCLILPDLATFITCTYSWCAHATHATHAALHAPVTTCAHDHGTSCHLPHADAHIHQ